MIKLVDVFWKDKFYLQFSDDKKIEIEFQSLRFCCPCAYCIDEITGRKLLQASNIKQNIAPNDVKMVGNYGLKVIWNDGHSTGIYSFALLHDLNPERIKERMGLNDK